MSVRSRRADGDFSRTAGQPLALHYLHMTILPSQVNIFGPASFAGAQLATYCIGWQTGRVPT